MYGKVPLAFFFFTFVLNFKVRGCCQCDDQLKVPCDANYQPENCDLPELPLSSLHTVDEFERCAPAVLPKPARNYYWSGSGREATLCENKKAYRRIHVWNRVLRDVSRNSLTTTLLGQRIAFPVCASPTALHKLADPEGEIATAKGVSSVDTVMILSSLSTTALEQVRASFGKGSGHLWMQTYLFEDKRQTEDIVRRAERQGFEAIVVTVDSPISPESRCNTRYIVLNFTLPNFFGGTLKLPSSSVTFNDLAWLCRFTKLPVVAKGILTVDDFVTPVFFTPGVDAVRAARAGVSGILVSNHGGRQLDSTPATIDALPGVVSALRNANLQHVEVYVDGGVRNGMDVFKALLRGARAAFVGRPIIWGLAAGGEVGVRKVLNILRYEFNETMIVAGYSSPAEIQMEANAMKLF